MDSLMRGRSSRAASEAGGAPSVGERGASEMADDVASVGARSFASGLEMLTQDAIIAETALIPVAQPVVEHVVNEALGSSGSTELRAASVVDEEHDEGRAALAVLAGESGRGEPEGGHVAPGQEVLSYLDQKPNPFWSETH